MKKPTYNCENPSSNLLQGPGSGFPEAACASKVVSKAVLWFWQFFKKPAMNVHWRNSTNESEGKPEQNFDAAYGTIFRVVFSRKQAEILHLFFCLTSQAKSFKTISACSESTALI